MNPYQSLRLIFSSIMANTVVVGVMCGILILAIGIGANVAMFGVMNAALLKALPFPEPDRLVSGRATWSGRIGPSVSIPDYRDYRDRSDVFESLAMFRGGSDGHTILGGETPE